MKDKPFISIISPTYNHEDFIEDCIESVLLQTYDNWEMIIVDDASTDRTPEIVSEYAQKDKRIKFIRHKENYGPFNLDKTYNEALELANGEWIAILEGDDVWLPYKLERQVQVIKDLPEDVVVLGGVSGYILQKERKVVIPRNKFARYNMKFFEPFEPIPEILIRPAMLDAPLTVLIRKVALEKVGGFFQEPKEIVAVDFPTYVRLGKVGKFYNDNYIVGFWRRYSTSVSSKYEEIQTMATKSFIKEFLFKEFTELSDEIDECVSYATNLRLVIRKILDEKFSEAEEYLSDYIKYVEKCTSINALTKLKILILKLAVKLKSKAILEFAYNIKYLLEYKTLGDYKKNFIKDPKYSKVYILKT